MIIKLITEYPQFRKYYEETYQLCLNTEKVMNMFSKELQELDRNTVQYMIDEMQDTIDEMKGIIDSQKKTEAEHKRKITEKENLLAAKDNLLADKDKEIAKLKALLAASKK